MCIRDRAMGVRVMLSTEVKDIHNLFTLGYTHVILATGAWQKGSAGLEYGEEKNVIEFLEAAKKAPETLHLGKHVVVIGGVLRLQGKNNLRMYSLRYSTRRWGLPRL